MSEEKTYVDPNSGAAPQPGGYAGIHAAPKGFAVPADADLEEEFSPSEYEPPGGTGGGGKSVDEIAEAAEANKPESDEEKSEEEKLRLQALANPRQVLSDLNESANEHAVPEAGSEEEAVNDAALEHEAVDLNDAGEEGSEESYDPSQYSVEEVNAYLSENPDQKDAVVAAEKGGKGRKGITGE